MLKILTLIFLLAATAFARTPDTGFLNRTIVTAETTYRYQVFVPAAWNRHSKWPVILFLHGSGERGDDGLLQTDVGLAHAIRKRIQKLPAIVVMPQCRNHKAWTDPDMEAQTLAALEQSMKEFRGDPDRVYLTGLSMGGYGGWESRERSIQKFAAIAIICGQAFTVLGRAWLISDRERSRVKDPYLETARRIGRTPVWCFMAPPMTRCPSRSRAKW